MRSTRRWCGRRKTLTHPHSSHRLCRTWKGIWPILPDEIAVKWVWLGIGGGCSARWVIPGLRCRAPASQRNTLVSCLQPEGMHSVAQTLEAENAKYV
jgi:hypothetical protein